MTELEARGKALEKLAVMGYAMNWPGKLVVTQNPPPGDGIVFAIPDDVGSSQILRWLGEDWPPMYRGYRVYLQPRHVRWRWFDPTTRAGYRESRVFVYALTEAEHGAFLAFCDGRERP